jgi:murein DD-endopeptidase MepM/ murein hydrolase activator NlpD
VVLTAAEYKKLETQFAHTVGLHLRRMRASLIDALVRALKRGGQRFTVMVIPHSENRIFNFQISFFSIIFFTVMISLVLGGFVLLAAHLRPMTSRLKRVSLNLRTSETAIEDLRDQISSLRRAERGFRAGVRGVRLALANQTPLPSIGTPEVSSLYPVENSSDLADLKNATSFVDTTAETLKDIGKVLKTYKEFLADTPTLWPLKGVHGVITTRFGWTINPFTSLGYLHLGVDIAWAMGTPIVAAANGVVVQTGYNSDLGNFVAIQHKYGFMTRYLHMMRIATHRGAHVNRGDVIGYLGTTGLSTGPHLHYEVHLGGNYLDPMNFLSIPPDLAAPRSHGVASD